MTAESGARTVAGYGAWGSPITTGLLVAGAVGLSEVQGDGDDLWWNESRPEEGGRVQLVRLDGETGERTDVLPDGYAARTRVHEYGGGAWRAHRGTVWFSNWADQRLHRLDPGGDPVALTPEGCRYADMDVAPDGTWLVAVREDHRGDGEPVNEIVRIDTTTGEETVLVTGPDFVASPRISADAGITMLAWTQWDHPHMPWDSAEVWVADLDGNDLIQVEHLAGGTDEWASQPTWATDNTLWLSSDRADRVAGGRFAEVYRWDGGDDLERVTDDSGGDIATPPWVFRMSRLVAQGIPSRDDPFGWAAISRGGTDHLVRILPSQNVIDVPTPFTAWSSLAPFAGGVVAVAAGPTSEAAIVEVRPVAEDTEGAMPLARTVVVPALAPTGFPTATYDEPVEEHVAITVIRGPRNLGLRPEQIALPESIEFPSIAGRTAYALYYPPTNPDHVGPDGERPPLLVDIHGGPTSAARPQFQLGVQFWTSRGFAVVDVNYGGSTGYGRAYRELLNGQWGVVDVEDCVAAARFLADRGDVDPDRMAIRGGSAGGFTTLAALAFHDTFAAGVSKYGVADLAVLAQETHKFESRYLDTLVGPWPEAEARYRERSPLYHADRIRVPLLVLQGLEDEVVPPNQSELIVDALKANGVPVAYLAFEGEQHGFRKAETIVRAAEAELSFYGQVFGFTPADDLEPVELG